jgi:hypothetical protein
MATLNNPINPQNIVDRYSDFVTAVANAGISWGNNAKPFDEMDVNQFGGSTGGRAIGITGNSIGEVDTVITATNIFDTLMSETVAYTNIRNLRAILNVEGGGGNTGSRPNPGAIYDNTAVAYMNVDYKQPPPTMGTPDKVALGITSGEEVNSANLETLFTDLRTNYNLMRANTTTVQTNVCHASCHSSCHGSRGRR